MQMGSNSKSSELKVGPNADPLLEKGNLTQTMNRGSQYPEARSSNAEAGPSNPERESSNPERESSSSESEYADSTKFTDRAKQAGE